MSDNGAGEKKDDVGNSPEENEGAKNAKNSGEGKGDDPPGTGAPPAVGTPPAGDEDGKNIGPPREPAKVARKVEVVVVGAIGGQSQFNDWCLKSPLLQTRAYPDENSGGGMRKWAISNSGSSNMYGSAVNDVWIPLHKQSGYLRANMIGGDVLFCQSLPSNKQYLMAPIAVFKTDANGNAIIDADGKKCIAKFFVGAIQGFRKNQLHFLFVDHAGTNPRLVKSSAIESKEFLKSVEDGNAAPGNLAEKHLTIIETFVVEKFSRTLTEKEKQAIVEQEANNGDPSEGGPETSAKRPPMRQAAEAARKKFRQEQRVEAVRTPAPRKKKSRTDKSASRERKSASRERKSVRRESQNEIALDATRTQQKSNAAPAVTSNSAPPVQTPPLSAPFDSSFQQQHVHGAHAMQHAYGAYPLQMHHWHAPPHTNHHWQPPQMQHAPPVYNSQYQYGQFQPFNYAPLAYAPPPPPADSATTATAASVAHSANTAISSIQSTASVAHTALAGIFAQALQKK